MPESVVCICDKGRLGIKEALDLRHGSPKSAKPKFTCEVCKKPVRAHKEGTDGQAAHFEHFTWNEDCPLCDARRV